MKLKTILLTILLYATAVHARDLTDMAGRKLTIPDHPSRILAYDAKTSIMLFRCAGKQLIAKGMLPGKKKYSYINAEYQNLPTIDVKNVENILLAAPDLIIVGSFLPEDVSSFNELQDKIHIPVVVIDLSIEKLDKTYLFLGKLLQKEAECAPYVQYLSQLYTNVQKLQKAKPKIPGAVYYALGFDGLTTDPSLSKHTEIFDLLKIQNAAKVEIPTGGHAHANMEQVLVWNPDYIFTAVAKDEPNPYDAITTSAQWAGIAAVRNKKVYKVPCEPMSWFDHPPSINRIPGMVWLLQIFYNQSAPETQIQITKFFTLFYGYDLTNAEYEALFK